MLALVPTFRRAVAVIGVAFVAALGPGGAHAASAIPPNLIHDLALGENDDKIKAMGQLAASGDEGALELLLALQAGEVQTAGEVVLRVKDGKAVELATGKSVEPLPESRDDVVLNNRVRRELGSAIAALKLASTDRSARLEAAKALQSGADEEMLPVIQRALAKEQDPDIKALLMLTQATVQMSSTDKATRVAAIR